jgi:hypothetical protein
MNICMLNLAYFMYKYYTINWLKMSVKKRVLPNYVDKKLQICKMSKLHKFVITNICNQIFVTFGRIGPNCFFVKNAQ